MKILFTTPILEHPPVGGPQLRIENSIKALNIVSELHIISRVSQRILGGKGAEEFYRSLCREFLYSPLANPFPTETIKSIVSFRFDLRNRLLNRLLNIPFKILHRLNYLRNKNYPEELALKKDAKFIKKYVKEQEIDVIWFGYGNISFTLMKLLKEDLPEIKMICDTDSVWSRFVLRELDVEKNPARRESIKEKCKAKEFEEMLWVEFMDITTAVSEVDAEYYRSIASDENKIKLFSNVIDIDMYKNKPDKPEAFKNPSIYLAGTFWEKSPMENAARWIINDVLPLVKVIIPNIHLYIIGKNSDSVLSDVDDENITITGRLDSVLPYLCNADVSLVPLKFESGTRFKILEAGACGIPIVSTTLGAEGIPVKDNEDILIADTKEQFADAIIKLIGNKNISKKISKNCKKLIEENYSIKSLVKEGRGIIEYLSEGQ